MESTADRDEIAYADPPSGCGFVGRGPKRTQIKPHPPWGEAAKWSATIKTSAGKKGLTLDSQESRIACSFSRPSNSWRQALRRDSTGRACKSCFPVSNRLKPRFSDQRSDDCSHVRAIVPKAQSLAGFPKTSASTNPSLESSAASADVPSSSMTRRPHASLVRSYYPCIVEF